MAKEPIKFTDNEVKKINELRIEVSQTFVQLGQYSIERKKRLQELDDAIDKLVKRHAELVDIEQELFKELNDKYGDGNYDPETGIFTPVEIPETNPIGDPVK